ncbi:MAG: helix-hairpin-helix domain-containing protein [Actinomycetota bacterium]
MEGLGERIDTLSRGELAGLVVVIVATLAGAGLWYLRSLPKPIEVAMTQAPAAPVSGSVPGAATGSVTPTSAATLIVDVTGWVREPGVYEFPAGARVIDAVERAGGPRTGADLTLLNLAARLTDGQQIMVPKEGQTLTVPAPGSVGGTGGATGSIININTADATAFETLNGIGEVLAAAIVTYRDEHGPFASVDQLEEVPGIGPSTLEEIRDQVTV